MKIRIVMAGAVLAFVAGCDAGEFGRAAGPATTSDQRVASFRAQLASRPDDVKALIGIGDEYARQSEWARASGAYREALIVDAGNAQALVGYSSAQAGLGEYASALSNAQAAVGQRANVEAIMAAATALNGQGRHGEARGLLDQALAANPRDLDVRNNMALTLALAKNSAAYQMQRSVAFAPDADFRHRRNFYLIAAMLGQEAAAKNDGASLGLSADEIQSVTSIGRKARTQGMRAFGVTSKG
jgi:tetratricopeptide (TPR) repeat protein